MSTAKLTASLTLWRRRHAYRQLRLAMAHKRNDPAAVAKWHSLLAEAGRKVRHRQAQLRAKQPKRATDPWMPGARKVPRSGTPWQVSCAPKGVLHTTEGAGDATPTLDANGDHPQFQVERNGRITQYIPLTQGGKALKHVGAPTNGAHAFQIEVCGWASKTDWPDAQKKAVREVMRYIEAYADMEPQAPHSFTKPVRLTDSQWLATEGWVGHVHVPGNDHEDPGHIAIADLL